MTDEFDVLKNQAEWKEAKKAAEEDLPDTMATTLIIMKRVGRRVTAMDKKIASVDDRLEKYVKSDDRRHDSVVGMLGEHIGQPAPIAHPNTEECVDGENCGEKEPNAAVRPFTNPGFLKILSGVLSVLVLVLFGVAGGV